MGDAESIAVLELGFRWIFTPLLALVLLGGLLPGLRQTLETLFAHPPIRRLMGIPFLLASVAWLGSFVWPALDQSITPLILAELVVGIPLIFRWLYTPYNPIKTHGQSR